MKWLTQTNRRCLDKTRNNKNTVIVLCPSLHTALHHCQRHTKELWKEGLPYQKSTTTKHPAIYTQRKCTKPKYHVCFLRNMTELKKLCHHSQCDHVNTSTTQHKYVENINCAVVCLFSSVFVRLGGMHWMFDSQTHSVVGHEKMDVCVSVRGRNECASEYLCVCVCPVLSWRLNGLSPTDLVPLSRDIIRALFSLGQIVLSETHIVWVKDCVWAIFQCHRLSCGLETVLCVCKASHVICMECCVKQCSQVQHSCGLWCMCSVTALYVLLCEINILFLRYWNLPCPSAHQVQLCNCCFTLLDLRHCERTIRIHWIQWTNQSS